MGRHLQARRKGPPRAPNTRALDPPVLSPAEGSVCEGARVGHRVAVLPGSELQLRPKQRNPHLIMFWVSSGHDSSATSPQSKIQDRWHIGVCDHFFLTQILALWFRRPPILLGPTPVGPWPAKGRRSPGYVGNGRRQSHKAIPEIVSPQLA